LLLLRTCYRRVRIVKPLTSRPANSEKYVVCTGFSAAAVPQPLMGRLQAAIVGYEVVTTPLPLSSATTPRTGASWPDLICNAFTSVGLALAHAFVADLVQFNTIYIARQVSYICATVLLICAHDAAPVSAITNDVARIHCQLMHSIRWCHKYDMRIAVDALARYRSVLASDHA
jgi:hypothetical protein